MFQLSGVHYKNAEARAHNLGFGVAGCSKPLSSLPTSPIKGFGRSGGDEECSEALLSIGWCPSGTLRKSTTEGNHKIYYNKVYYRSLVW